MPRRFIQLVPQLVFLAGYALLFAVTATIDLRLSGLAIAAVFIYEGREALR